MDKNLLNWNPQIGDAADRLTITQLKEFLIPGQRDRYTKEINDLIHDIDIMVENRFPKGLGEFMRNLCVLAVMNDRIWVNESNHRNGIKTGNSLDLTHGLNSIRCLARAKVQAYLDPTAPQEFKADSVQPPENWIPSGY